MQNWYLFFPLAGAAAGWLIHTLVLVIAIPAGQRRIARALGQFAGSELAGSFNLGDRLQDPSHFEKIRPDVENHIDDFLRVKLAKQMPMVSMFIGDKTIHKMKAVFMEELEKLFPAVIAKFAANFQQDLRVEEMIEARIGSMSREQWKGILEKNLKREFRLFQLMGLVTGFIIGVLLVVALWIM
jgi:uncharacterized membrane protein YheB (UPF0754 family)